MLRALCVLMAMDLASAEDTVGMLEQIVRSALESTDVTIFLYHDMICVSAYSPRQITDECFENAAIFTTLANWQIFYGHFTLNKSYGVLPCDSSNVIESVLPSEDEVLTLVYMTVKYMDAFGQGIASLCTDGANPYEAFEACRALLDEE